jgi:hypothetical protein
MRRTYEDTQPVPFEPTSLIPVARAKPVRPPATRGFAERLALFVSGVDRDRVDELLAGLTGTTQKQAIAFAQEAIGWDSATRQGRMAVVFGGHPNATDRLKLLVSDASPMLRLAVFRRLAPWQKSLFPKLELELASVAPPAPAMDALAERLIREATR